LISPVWSAITCDFPGVGVYIGQAPRFEHLIIARMLSPRQMRLVTGARTRLGPGGGGGGEVGLEYYAVRDPSVVRVVPLDKPPINGFRHVSLIFQLERPQLLPDAVSLHPGLTPARAPVGTFLLTVGLPSAREEEFYRQAIVESPVSNFTDLYARIHDMGCREP
jgi:hypothetical protein